MRRVALVLGVVGCALLLGLCSLRPVTPPRGSATVARTPPRPRPVAYVPSRRPATPAALPDKPLVLQEEWVEALPSWTHAFTADEMREAAARSGVETFPSFQGSTPEEQEAYREAYADWLNATDNQARSAGELRRAMTYYRKQVSFHLTDVADLRPIVAREQELLALSSGVARLDVVRAHACALQTVPTDCNDPDHPACEAAAVLEDYATQLCEGLGVQPFVAVRIPGEPEPLPDHFPR